MTSEFLDILLDVLLNILPTILPTSFFYATAEVTQVIETNLVPGLGLTFARLALDTVVICLLVA